MLRGNCSYRPNHAMVVKRFHIFRNVCVSHRRIVTFFRLIVTFLILCLNTLTDLLTYLLISCLLINKYHSSINTHVHSKWLEATFVYWKTTMQARSTNLNHVPTMKLYFRCLKNERYRQGYSHNNSINLGTNSFFVVPRPICFVMGISLPIILLQKIWSLTNNWRNFRIIQTYRSLHSFSLV